MNRIRTSLFRCLCVVLCFAMVNLCVPYSAVITFGKPVADQVLATAEARNKAAKDLAVRRAKSVSHELSSKEELATQGKTGENPYLAGQSKWDPVYKGVDLMTGNYSTSVTDLTFDDGYGIPVNVTRSYSANDMDEGPFGKGWTLSADVQTTASGLLKSPSAPVTSVPVTFNERPSSQLCDPNATVANGAAVQPVAAVIAVDAGGTTETVQKDVDGILTTPPWDNNTSDPVYRFVSMNGSVYQVLVSNLVTTMDGTVYTYQNMGSYPNGMQPWGSTATPEPSNVLKVTKAVDRQGNETDYTYDTTRTVSFTKSNGLVQENPLIAVQMPNGHRIAFTWTDVSGNGTWRVTSVTDGTRTVSYGYSTLGLLTSVTTPGGKTTTYGYGAAQLPDLNGFSMPSCWTGVAATNLLTSITDPRGLTTTIEYVMSVLDIRTGVSFDSANASGPFAFHIGSPNGVQCYLSGGCTILPYGKTPWNTYLNGDGYGYLIGSDWAVYEEHVGSPTGPLLLQGTVTGGFNAASGVAQIIMANNFAIGYGPDGGNDIPTTVWERDYNISDETLIHETRYTAPEPYTNIGALIGDTIGPAGSPYFVRLEHHLPLQTYAYLQTDDQKTYNFMGNPLSETVTESHVPTIRRQQLVVDRTATTSYAYWGADKYYQQKAVQDQAGRYSYTDYYPNTAPAGSRGQTYEVFDAKNAGFYLDTTVTPPSYAVSADYWKYQIKPSSPSAYSATFQYDSVGRTTDVWKLQSTATSPWSYVQTHSTYGANTDGSWGQANQVVEDYGDSTHINRATNTLHYTSWGKADQVMNAAGNVFVTTYDLDGNVQAVAQATSNGNVPIATYAYGSNVPASGSIDVTYGQLLSEQDGLSGLTENLTYTTSGAGIGQVASVTESGGPNPNYTVAYTYNSAGDRQTVNYATPNSNTTWGYYDYFTVGDPDKPKRVFQTMCQLNSAGGRTSEEYHYAYDSTGRLAEAAFAQTPQQTSATSGGGWYDTTAAATRARTEYIYDSAGRIDQVATYWDTYSNGSYSSQPIIADTCGYELGGALNRGLKLSSTLATQSQSVTSNFGYDPALDYLRSASYGDGLSNASPTWTYDAAGNRTDSVCDNLNRPTSIQGAPITSDILGNRLTAGSASYGWDLLNRMTSCTSSSGTTTNYSYRPDGMRVLKSSGSTSTIYRYDGQMGIEDVNVNGTATTVTDYAIGARGIDAISVAGASGTTVSYPLYDSHGNMVSTLAKSGSGYTYSAIRTFDAWGNIRFGAQAGDPKGRYCADLGHKQDDESGLVYMRARYYEPGSGRFLSEDPDRQNVNWFAYSSNDPINRIDSGGSSDELVTLTTALQHWLEGLGLTKLAAHIVDKLAGGLIKDVIKSLRSLAKALISGGIDLMKLGIIELSAVRAAGGSFGQALSGYAGKSILRGVMEVLEGAALFLIAGILEVMS